jgi:dienelactone hydrolase
MIAILLLAAALDSATSPSPATATSTCVAAVGFIGTVCAPETPGKHPALLLLGGSEGGNSSMPIAAAAYAKHGYVAASVAYFGLPGLPDTLELIPVETVGKALAIIEQRDDVDADRIGIFGGSKGGELALLAASTYPKIHAVVSYVGSPFAWAGISSSPLLSDTTSSWTVGGMPVPFVPLTSDAPMSRSPDGDAPLRVRPLYDAARLKNADAIEPAFFHLEKINGPVLFVSAGDDAIWNSPELAQMGLAYLKKRHHPFVDALKNYPGAGHLFLFSFPNYPLVTRPLAGGRTLLEGGSPEINATAGADARALILAFFNTALANHER